MSTYTYLITSQHRGKPKFESLVNLDTAAFSEISEMLTTVPGKYDLDTAVGVQLDTVGEWVGLSRYISTELPNVYFSFDDASLGLDAGLWKGPFDPTTGISRLDDESYRLALRAKIGANHWDGSVETLQSILDQVFTGYDTSVFTGDHQDMSMSFYMVGATPPPIIVALLTGGYLAVKPFGVSILGYFKPSVDGAPLFALDASGEYAAGLDSGALAISI
jgi:hypothetical protein